MDIGYFSDEDDINDERDKISTNTLTSEDRELQKEVDKSFTLESTYLPDEEDCTPYFFPTVTRKIDFEEKPKGNNKITIHNNQFNIKIQLEDLMRSKQAIGYKSQKQYGKCTLI
jgi:hypothetical protein